MHGPLSKALEWSEAVRGTRGRAPIHVTVRHLCFKGGRVKIASTGAEEAASEQGQHARGAGGDASGSGCRQANRAGTQCGSSCGVAVVGITVIAAGAPAALGASSDLNESQRLVTLAELNQQAITLAHSLADERDEVTAHIAGGREDEDATSGTTSPAARVDQQVDEIREAAPASLSRDLAAIPSLRRTALTGKGSAMEAYQAYSEVIDKLHGVADELDRKTPPRAADATRAPLALGGAVEQASATRGLILAALAVPGTKPQQQIDPFTGLPVQTQDEGGSENDRDRDELSAAAQQARVRELASSPSSTRRPGPPPATGWPPRSPAPRSPARRSTSPGSPTGPSCPTPTGRPTPRRSRRRSPPGSTACAGSSPRWAPSRSSAWRGCATTTSPRWSSAWPCSAAAC